jgi:hypothetical protein
METKETNISPWLHSLQQTFRTNELFTAIDDSVLRVRNTRKKINSILNTLYGLEERSGVNLTSYRERMHDMIAIRDAIRVYGIYHPAHSRREKEPNMLWNTYDPFVLSDYKEGREWFDYFGKDDGITEVGGYVVVSLSDKGIEYLNGISEKVSYWSSSPDKRYYTTVTI